MKEENTSVQQKLYSFDKPPIFYKHLLSSSSTLVRFSELKKGTEQEKNVNETEKQSGEKRNIQGKAERKDKAADVKAGQRPRPSGCFEPLSTNEPDVCILAGHREPQQ